MSARTIEPTGSKPNKAAARAKQPKRAPKVAKKGSHAKSNKTVAPGPPSGESGSKKAEVIALLRRAKGVTLPEIQKLTGWQKHTVRGFVSLLGSNSGLKIISTRNDAGERTYRVAK
jgi:Protein of unknown function (DUF3489)